MKNHTRKHHRNANQKTPKIFNEKNLQAEKIKTFSIRKIFLKSFMTEVPNI